MIGYIYALYIGSEDNVFYVGSSVNTGRRLTCHRNNFSWVSDDTKCVRLRENKKEIKLIILDDIIFTDTWELLSLEIYWIHQMKAWGFHLQNREYYYTRNKRGSSITLYEIPEDIYAYLLEFRYNFYLRSKIKLSFCNAIIQIIKEHRELSDKIKTNGTTT